jgi:hypothetical protein
MFQFQHTLKSSHTPPIGRYPLAERSQDSLVSVVSCYKLEDGDFFSRWGQIFFFFAAKSRLSFAFLSLPPIPEVPGHLKLGTKL